METLKTSSIPIDKNVNLTSCNYFGPITCLKLIKNYLLIGNLNDINKYLIN